MKPKKYFFSENRNIQGGSQKQRLSWYKPRDELLISGPSPSGLYNIQARYENLRICARRRRHESNGRTRVVQWFDHQERREVFTEEARQGKDGFCMRAGIVSMEKDALWPLQCDSHLPTTNGTGADKRNEEIRQFSNILRR